MRYFAYFRICLAYQTFQTLLNTPQFDSLMLLTQKHYDEVEIIPNVPQKITYYDFQGNLYQPKHDVIALALIFLQTHHSLKTNCHIIVHKSLPPNSGLATNAACAAVVLKHFQKLHNLTFNVVNLARFVDANVPFYLSGYQFASVSGWGGLVSDCSKYGIPEVTLHFNPHLKPLFPLEQMSEQAPMKKENQVNWVLFNWVNYQIIPIYQDFANKIYKIYPQLLTLVQSLTHPYQRVGLVGLGTTLFSIKHPNID